MAGACVPAYDRSTTFARTDTAPRPLPRRELDPDLADYIVSFAFGDSLLPNWTDPAGADGRHHLNALTLVREVMAERGMSPAPEAARDAS